MNPPETGHIRTFTGRKFWPLQPRAEDLDIRDIAHALSNICRFTGHVRKFYSVAEHSVRVSELLPPPLKLWGLLHDASEAYMCDLASPVKSQCPGYRAAEVKLEFIIAERFGLEWPRPAEIKAADVLLFLAEKRDLMPGKSFTVEYPRIRPWSPATAKARFLRAFRALQ